MNKNVKRSLRISLLVLLLPVALVALIAILLYVPPVQNWAAKRVAAYMSTKTGKQISVGHVSLSFPLDLGVENFLMTQSSGNAEHPVDTIANAGRLTLSVQLMPLFHSEVKVDKLNLSNVRVNTVNFISDTQIIADVGNLSLNSRSINWKTQKVIVNRADLRDAQLTILLSDTAKEDTTKSKSHWMVDLHKLRLYNTNFNLHMPGDSMSVAAAFVKNNVSGVHLDLGKSIYKVSKLDWKGGSLNYDQNFTVKSKGFDANHLAINDVRLLASDFSYFKPNLSVNILEASMLEKCGLRIDSLSMPFSMDSISIHLPKFNIVTSASRINGELEMNLNAFAERNPGQMFAKINGIVAKNDINAFTGGKTKSIFAKIPAKNFKLRGTVRGNLQHISLRNVAVGIPNHLSLVASGWLANPTEDYRKGDLSFKLSAPDARFIESIALDKNMRKTVNIPRNIQAQGTVAFSKGSYGANISLSQGGGSIKAKALYKTANSQYQLTAQGRNFHVQNFAPTIGVRDFSGSLSAHGAGTDFMSRHTLANVKASIKHITYDKYNLKGINLNARLANGRLHAVANSRYSLAKGFFGIDGIISKNLVDVKFTGNIENLDFYRLGFVSEPLAIKGKANLNLRTDLNNNLVANGLLGNLTIQNRDTVYNPGDLTLDILTSIDTTKAIVNCGDLALNAGCGGGYKHIIKVADKIQRTLKKQIDNKWVDQKQLFALLPNGRIRCSSGGNNIISNMLKARGLSFSLLNADLTMEKGKGINGFVIVDSLCRDTLRLDSVDLRLNSDDKGLNYALNAFNGSDNPYPFHGLLHGGFFGNGTNSALSIWDGQQRLGIDISLAATLHNGGVKLTIDSPDAILGYKKFAVNNGNFISIDANKRLAADMKLLAQDGAGVQIYADTTNTQALQDVTLSMHQFELEKIFAVLPFTPQISGVVNGDFHAIQTAEQLTVSADISTKNLLYQNCPMGNLGAELVYLPLSDGTHQVSGILTESDEEVGSLNGSYSSAGQGNLDATLQMDKLPLNLVNGFVPDQIVGLEGKGEGALTLKGPLNKLDINGEVFLDSSYLVSVPYGVRMRFADDPVRIVNSKLLFENFEMFANNDQPMDIKGSLDMTDLSNMKLNAQMRARNFQIIDAKENPRSQVFGKAFVDFFGSINGPLANLKMKGLMNVLGATDMTYIMRDNELATDNELTELVNFVDLSDTIADDVTLPPLEGFNLDMTINIDESARIFCALNSDKSNYADLMGKGSLRMQYNDQAGVRLSGRYTLSNGEVKYSLPIIPLRTFTIADGSYIDFDGDPMNPRLNITATENVRASVSTSGSSDSRSVDFTTGVQITNRLSKPGILFIINAPNDRTVTDELNTMSTEERAKVAVTMLASGIYVANGNTSSFTMNSALSSFLQTEINNIAGRAMQSMGLNLQMGVENSINSSGSMHTDYSFQFSKRFFNNRLSVLVGGKVSTGSQISDQSNSFFDNVELQYRLGDAESRYIRAFYNNNTYDWLDGMIGEYGVGFRWRRQLDNLGQLFRFHSTPIIPIDSTKNDDSK